MDKFDISKSVNDFINRKIYKHISPEILLTISDDKLEQAIIDYVSSKFKSPKSKLQIVSSMSLGFQILYSTWILEAEVNNGGFNQFFCNSSGQFAEMALMSIKTLNALDYYEIIKGAIAIHNQEKERNPLKKLYSRRMLKNFVESYKFSSLNKCDEEFFKLDNSLKELRIQYIHNHPEEFIGN